MQIGRQQFYLWKKFCLKIKLARFGKTQLEYKIWSHFFIFAIFQKLDIQQFSQLNIIFINGPEEPHHENFDFLLPHSIKYCDWNMWWKFWSFTMSHPYFRVVKCQRPDSPHGNCQPPYHPRLIGSKWNVFKYLTFCALLSL